MTDAEKLLEVAESFIGTAENPLGSNNVVFNRDYYGRQVVGDNYKWCMVFVWDCFRMAKLSQYFYGGSKTASCTTLMKWATNNGYMVYKDYRMGDVFLYDQDGVRSDSEHTGIYTGRMENGCYVAVEGNYADKVAYVKRRQSEVIGAFRPPFPDGAESDDGWSPHRDNIPVPELHYGDGGNRTPELAASVQAMQILLEGNGFSVGKWGTDGDFLNDTADALKRYQTAHGLIADSICGIKTWSSLLGVRIK